MQCRNFNFFQKKGKWTVIAFTLIVSTLKYVQGQTSVNTPCSTDQVLSPQRGVFPPSTNNILTAWAINLQIPANSAPFEGVTPSSVSGGYFLPSNSNPGVSPGIWMDGDIVRLASDFISACDLANAEQFELGPEVTGLIYTPGNRSVLFMYDDVQIANDDLRANR